MANNSVAYKKSISQIWRLGILFPAYVNFCLLFDLKFSTLNWKVFNTAIFLQSILSQSLGLGKHSFYFPFWSFIYMNWLFMAGLSVDGDSQGLDRILGALSAHMWPGMTLKSGDKIMEPSLPENRGSSSFLSSFTLQ